MAAAVALPAVIGACIQAALRAAKPGISYGLNAAAKKWPKFNGPRQFIKGATGFAERQSAAGSSRKKKGGKKRNGGKKRGFAERVSGGNGGVVKTMDAPVAFSRTPIGNFRKTLKTSADGEVVHVCNLLGKLTTNAAGSTFDIASLQTAVYPTNAALFPSDSSGMLMWSKYKVLMFKIHYCHFAPTSSQAAVMLWWHPDPDITVPTTSAILMGYKDVSQGSSYEDLGLKCSLEGVTKDWLDNEATVVGDAQLSYAGRVAAATDNNIPTATAIGNLYCEAIFEFCQRKPTSITTGLILHGLARSDKETKLAMLEQLRLYLKAKVDDAIDARIARLCRSDHAEGDFSRWIAENSVQQKSLQVASMSQTPSSARRNQ